MPPRTMLQKPVVTYPGGTSRYLSDRSDQNGTWIALVATVILSYSSQAHFGTKLRDIVSAIKATLDVEDWCSPPGFLRATVLKVLNKLPLFVALPLQEGLTKGKQIWRLDPTRSDVILDELQAEMKMLAHVSRKRWHWEVLSGNPRSIRRILNELRGESRNAATLARNRTMPPGSRVEFDRSTLDLSPTKLAYCDHARRFSAPATAGSFRIRSREPLVSVDNIAPGSPHSLGQSADPTELPLAPHSPAGPSNPFLTRFVDCRVESDSAEAGSDPRPEAPSGSTGLAVSAIISRGSGSDKVRPVASQSAATFLVSSPLLPTNLPSYSAGDNTNTPNSGATLFLPSSSPERVVGKVGKRRVRRQEDDEEYLPSDSPASECSNSSHSFDLSSDSEGEEEPHTAGVLLSLTRSGAEFGPAIVLGGGNGNQPPRDVTPVEEDVARAIEKPVVSSSKRKIDDDVIERHVVRKHKRRVTITENSATAIGRSSRRATQPETAKTTSPIHHVTLADDDEVLKALVDVFNRRDGPNSTLEEKVIWDAFRRVMPHITRKAYHKVLSHGRLFVRVFPSSTAPNPSSEQIQFYRYVPQRNAEGCERGELAPLRY